MNKINPGKAHWMIIPPKDGGEGEGSTGGEGQEGAQGGTGPSVDELMATPEMQAAIQAKLDAEVAGLKAKNTELIDKQKSLKEAASQYEGIDIEKIKTLQKQIEDNEEMKLLSEGKTEEVVERRVEAMRKDFSANIDSRDTKISELESKLHAKQEEVTSLVVDGNIRQAYTALDFEPTAMDDVITLGRTTFVMDESGKATPRDESGNIIFSKDGKTPIAATEWLEQLAEKKKYLRRNSSGAGASGSGRSGSGASIDTSKMSSTQRIAHGLAQGDLN